MSWLPPFGGEVLWIVAFVMWAWDAKVPAFPGARILKSSPWGKRSDVAEYPIGAFRRWAIPPNPFEPFTITLVAATGEAGEARVQDKQGFEEAMRPFDRLSIPCGAIFILVFAVTPLLTLRINLLLAMLAVLLLAWGLIGYVGMKLWRRRDALGLSKGQVAAIVAHAVLFPPYGANLSRAAVGKAGLARPSRATWERYVRKPDWQE